MFGHNRGLGLFSKGSGGLLNQTAGNPTGPRMLNLVASEGLSGNGMATIGMDNTFSVIAHLPAPHSMSPYSPAVYAAYLVDNKGKNGFYAGTLRAAGNGMYQANFRSPIPLVHYDKVVISLESPHSIGQAPQGPIIMKVKEGMFDSLGPVKKVGSDMWGKVKGFIGNRFGGKTEEEPEQAPQASYQAPQAQGYQAGYQGGYQQQGYQQQGYQQQGNQQQYYQAPPRPQGGYPQTSQANPANQANQANQGYQGYQRGQAGGYQYNSYPRGRGVYSPETYRAPMTPMPQNMTQPSPQTYYSQPQQAPPVMQPQQAPQPAPQQIIQPQPPISQPQQTMQMQPPPVSQPEPVSQTLQPPTASDTNIE